MPMDTLGRWVARLRASLEDGSSSGGASPPARARKTPPPRRSTLVVSRDVEVTDPVARALLAYAPSPTLAGRLAARRPVRLDDERTHERVRLTDAEQATGWLFGVFFDHMIPADRAWEAPYLLAERLGHLDVRRIAAMPRSRLHDAIRRRGDRKALHRLHPRLAASLHAACVQIAARDGCDVENVWPDGITVRELQTRLARFPGLGPKLRSMAIRLLVDRFGRRFGGWRDADIAVDRHVARVFLRTGLVAPPRGARSVTVAQIHDDVVAAARRRCPTYPAALDYPAITAAGRSRRTPPRWRRPRRRRAPRGGTAVARSWTRPRRRRP